MSTVMNDQSPAGTGQDRFRHRVLVRLPGAGRRGVFRLLYWGRLTRHWLRKEPRECPCCGYRGRFAAFGVPPRLDAQCRGCGAYERHRLLVLADRARGLFGADDAVLHFAPEGVVRRLVEPRVRAYVTADLFAPYVDRRENIECMSIEDDQFDVVLCSHVLEHVDDRRALAELHRILRPGGRLIAMVPIVEGWSRTYENPEVVRPRDRELHFGQHDHVRWYGADFRTRVEQAGFSVEEFTAFGAEVVRYALWPGEKVFICEKRAPESR